MSKSEGRLRFEDKVREVGLRETLDAEYEAVRQEEKRTTSEKVHGCSKDGVKWRQMIQLKEELCVCSSFQSFSDLTCLCENCN